MHLGQSTRAEHSIVMHLIVKQLTARPCKVDRTRELHSSRVGSFLTLGKRWFRPLRWTTWILNIKAINAFSYFFHTHCLNRIVRLHHLDNGVQLILMKRQVVDNASICSIRPYYPVVSKWKSPCGSVTMLSSLGSVPLWPLFKSVIVHHHWSIKRSVERPP